MVDGDGVDDDGGEDSEEILLPGVESRTNLTPETKVAAELRITNQPLLLGLRFSRIYDGLGEGESRGDAQVAQGLGWRAQRGWARHLVLIPHTGSVCFVSKSRIVIF